MRLLFDANLSPALPGRLSDLYPDSCHVMAFGLQSSDSAIWEHAKEGGYTIISKDSDFEQRALVFGAPPKVVWLRVGNCHTGAIESLLRQRLAQIQEFDSDREASLLVLP